MTGTMSSSDTVHIIGGGLAGSEAAWQAAETGIRVVLHEMRPDRMTEAHRTDGLAELVCSNSFRSDDAANNAVGLLHAEMRRLDSLIMRAADANQVPAGGALAVDRDGFSAAVSNALHQHPRIEIRRGEIAGLPPPTGAGLVVSATETTHRHIDKSLWTSARIASKKRARLVGQRTNRLRQWRRGEGPVATMTLHHRRAAGPRSRRGESRSFGC